MSALRHAFSILALTASLAVGGYSALAFAEDAGDGHHAAAAAADPHADAHHEAAHHAPSVGDLLFPAINFTIYLFIIVRFVIPAMREFLRRRRADIVEAASQASAALAHAEQSLAASKARLASLQTESDGIRRDLVDIANRQAERLVAQAEESGARRLADAALVAEQERRRALAEVRSAVANAAATLAEQQIRAALTADDQRAFVQQFLKEATPQREPGPLRAATRARSSRSPLSRTSSSRSARRSRRSRRLSPNRP